MQLRLAHNGVRALRKLCSGQVDGVQIAVQAQVTLATYSLY
jgi:hypothetical protein